MLADLTVKARIYGAAGYQTYWVITPQVIYQHTQPTADGFRSRTEYRAGDQLPVPYTDATIDVAALIEA